MSTARWRAGRCWRAATKASRTDSREAASSAGSPCTGITRSSAIGVTHMCSGSVAAGGSSADTGPPSSIGRARRCGVPQHVETHVRGDLVQPGAHRGAALEAVHRLPGAEQGLLHGVLGLGARAEHAVAVGGQLPSVLVELALDVEVDEIARGGHGAQGRAVAVAVNRDRLRPAGQRIRSTAAPSTRPWARSASARSASTNG